MTTALGESGLGTIHFPDGALITLRPVTVRDGRLLANFLTRLSPETRYRRFLSMEDGARAKWVATLIHADQLSSLVYGAFADNRFGSSLVAVAESIRSEVDVELAEFAIAVVEDWQNLGVGTLLARHLAGVARATGIKRWETYTLADNAQVEKVLSRVGCQVEVSTRSGMSAAVYDI